MNRQDKASDNTSAKGRRDRKTSDKRREIVRRGVEIFTEKGFHNTAVDEVVHAAGVPKGSFTYYFGSKDTYAIEVIEMYAEYFNRKLEKILTDSTLTPLQRIRAFADDAALGMQRYHFRRGCLIGNLGQEVGALNERFRVAILTALDSWQKCIESCLKEAVDCGELHPSVDPALEARRFWYSWEGAVLGAKLERSRAPLDALIEAFIASLTKADREQKRENR